MIEIGDICQLETPNIIHRFINRFSIKCFSTHKTSNSYYGLY